MRKSLAVLALLVVGCNSLAVSTVNLTKEERNMAQAIAEKRQQIQLERASANNEFQEKQNRLSERESILNVESAKLCFEFKKAHKLAPNTNYTLDEWNGQLVKQ